MNQSPLVRCAPLVLGLLATPSPAWSQTEPSAPAQTVVPPPLAAPVTNPGDAQALFASGRTLRNAGIGLTVTGIVMGVVGSIITVTGLYVNSNNLYIGLGVSLLTYPLAGAGIPLWVVGTRRMRRARQMGYTGLSSLSLHPALQLGPQGAGSGQIALGLRF